MTNKNTEKMSKKEMLIATMNEITAAHPECNSVQKMLQADLFVACKGDKIAIFNEDGTQLTPFELDNYAEPLGEVAEVFAGDKEGLVTRSGIYVKPFFDEMSENEGFVYVRVGDQWGYLDEDGTFIQEDDEEKKDEACLLVHSGW